MNKLALSALMTIALASVAPTTVIAVSNPQATASNAGKITSPPVVQGTGDTWAEIDWTTFAGGDSTVKYGTDPAHLDQSAGGTASNAQGQYQHHSVRIENLQPGTTYYFQASSGSGSTATSNEAPGTFTTKATGAAVAQSGDAQPASAGRNALKIINGPNVEGTGRDWATVAWTTNTGGSSIIRYGTDPNNLTQKAQAPYADKEGAAYQTHRVRIANLKPNTTYYYVVDSGQGEGTGTEAKGSIAQFTTKS